MIIYKAELEIADLIKNSTSASLIADIEISEPFPEEICQKALASMKVNTATPKTGDLYPVKSVFCSSNWNNNDDVFLVEEVWDARKTPVDKPSNIEHDQSKIIGHMVSQWTVDDAGDFVDDSLNVEDLPEMIHICSGSVIYIAWEHENRKKEVIELIQGIEDGEYSVSMEVLFPKFDYMLEDVEGNRELVIRNKDTAYLTKHLRVYGGTGYYNGYKVGRVLRNLTFSGQAYTTRPANVDSVILESASATINCVDKNEEINLMSDNDKNFEVELAKANTDIAKLEGELAALKQDNQSLTASLGEAEARLEKASACQCDSAQKIEQLEKDNAELSKQVAELELRATAAVRLSQLVDGGVDKARAKEIVAKFVNLNEDQFNTIANVYTEGATQPTEVATASVGPIDFPSKDGNFEDLQKAVSSILSGKQE